MKLIKIIALCVVVSLLPFLVLLLLGLAYSSRHFFDSAQIPGDRQIPITANKPITRPITSKQGTLSTIWVHLNNPDTKNQEPFTFSLSDQQGQVVREIPISGMNIAGNDWIKFQFAPLRLAGNESLTMRLSSTTQKDVDAVRAFTDDSGNVAYKAYGTLSPQHTALAVLGDVSRRFTDDIGFFVVYILMLGATLGGLVWVLTRSKKV